MRTHRLHWFTPDRGLVTGTRWSASLATTQALDPYLVWADMSGFLGFGGWEDQQALHCGRVPLLLEFDASNLSAAKVPELALIRIPGIYLNADTGATRHRQVTGVVQATEISKLLACKHLVRFQLGAPRLPGNGDLKPPLAGETSEGNFRTVLGFIDDGCAFAHPQFADSAGLTRVHALWDQERPEPDGVLTGWTLNPSLAYGMELRRDALLGACRERGHHRDPAQAPFAPYDAVDYVPQRPAFGHSSVRRHGPWLRPPLAAMATGTHGTSVMDLAMGRAPPLRQRLSKSDAENRMLRDSDRADEWAAVFVQLPSATVLDTTGGSLACHVLDGLHYIIDRAQRIAPIGSTNADDKRRFKANRIVVTVPFGAIAGGHDGGSIIERAMGNLVNDEGQQLLWIVLAAGNAHRSRSHARLALRPGQPGHLLWRVPPDNPLESYLELWVDLHDAQGLALPDAADRLLVGLTPPGGPTLQLTLGQWQTLSDSTAAGEASRCVAGAVFARRVAQTDRPATMVLLASAPTRPALPGEGPERSLGLSGDWEVALTYQPQASAQTGPVLQVHAWVERSDLLFGTRRGLQSQVRADEPMPLPTEFVPDVASLRGGWHEAAERLQAAFDPPRGFGSLAGGAPARKAFGEMGGDPSNLVGPGAVVTVGAYRLNDGEMASDSSGGPTREWTTADITTALSGLTTTASSEGLRQAPDADAPGDASAATRGLAVAGLRAGQVHRLSGTSAAAPTVARAIANAQSPPLAGTLPRDWARAAMAVAASPVRDQPPRSPGIGTADPARGTPHPTLDDRFRRGRWRAR